MTQDKKEKVGLWLLAINSILPFLCIAFTFLPLRPHGTGIFLLSPLLVTYPLGVYLLWNRNSSRRMRIVIAYYYFFVGLFFLFTLILATGFVIQVVWPSNTVWHRQGK